MSEYIYASNGEPLANERGEILLARAGEVVRCRDCTECEHWEATERKPERYICLSNYCIEVNPNGFCAWGEKRNND